MSASVPLVCRKCERAIAHVNIFENMDGVLVVSAPAWMLESKKVTAVDRPAFTELHIRVTCPSCGRKPAHLPVVPPSAQEGP